MRIMSAATRPRSIRRNACRAAPRSVAELLALLLVERDQLLALGTGALEISGARARVHRVAQAHALLLVGDAHIRLARGSDLLQRGVLSRVLVLLELRPYLVERLCDDLAVRCRQLLPPARVEQHHVFHYPVL